MTIPPKKRRRRWPNRALTAAAAPDFSERNLRDLGALPDRGQLVIHQELAVAEDLHQRVVFGLSAARDSLVLAVREVQLQPPLLRLLAWVGDRVFEHLDVLAPHLGV